MTSKSYDERTAELGQLAGLNRDHPDFKQVVDSLDTDSDLELSDFEKQVVTMMMTALSEIQRSKNSPYVSPKKAGNTATHTAQSIIDWDNLFERSGVNNIKTAQNLRKKGARRLLLHDAGEILGESSTVDSRHVGVGSKALIENSRADMEKNIAIFAMRLAARYIEKGDEKGFYEKIRELRDAAAVGSKHYPANVNRIISEPITLSSTKKMALLRLISSLKCAEAEPEKRDFCCWLLKGVEHLEGTHHILKHANRVQLQTKEIPSREIIALPGKSTEKTENGMPIVHEDMIVDSFSATKNFYYNEQEIGPLWKKAGENAIRRALAKQHTLDVYDTLIKCTESKPPVFRRIEFSKMSPGWKKTFLKEIEDGAQSETLESLLHKAQEQGKCWSATQLPLGSIVTADQVICLYKAAKGLVESIDPRYVSAEEFKLPYGSLLSVGHNMARDRTFPPAPQVLREVFSREMSPKTAQTLR